jgi:hypothetical protein
MKSALNLREAPSLKAPLLVANVPLDARPRFGVPRWIKLPGAMADVVVVDHEEYLRRRAERIYFRYMGHHRICALASY